MRSCVMACALLFGLTAPVQSQGAALVLRDVTVIDGTGRPAQPNRSIVIRDGRIAAVTDAATAPPDGARVLDLAGRFVIPGLVDAHVHVTSPFIIPAQQDTMLAFLFDSGVTSVRDLAGDAVVLAERAGLARDPALPSPRVFYSALMAGEDFLRTEPRAAQITHGGRAGEVAWLRGLTDSADLVSAVTAAKQMGATGIKLYANLPATLVQRVSAEAHRQGLKVWAHATLAPAKPSEVIAAGADIVSHIDMFVFESESVLAPSIHTVRAAPRYAATPVDGAEITAVLQAMKSRGTMLDATLFVMNSQGLRAEADETRAHLHPMREWSFALARRAHALGIPFVTGTDLMGRPGIDAVSLVHEEMALLVERAGMTPLQAIQAATLNGARALGRDSIQGTIEPGKRADLVVLTADPLADVRNTRRIEYVVKAGQVHEPSLARDIAKLGASRVSDPNAPLVWRESWPGTQMAVVSGDPNQPGREFRFQFRMPADYWIPPHTHPVQANIRVLSGEFVVGMGDRIDEGRAQAYRPGTTAVIQPGMAHFEGTRGQTLIEISGIGPWSITFLDPNAQPGIRRR